MKVRMIAPSGKTIQQKIATILRCAKEEAERGYDRKMVEEMAIITIKRVVEKCLLEFVEEKVGA